MVNQRANKLPRNVVDHERDMSVFSHTIPYGGGGVKGVGWRNELVSAMMEGVERHTVWLVLDFSYISV